MVGGGQVDFYRRKKKHMETVEKVHQFIAENGHERRGKHHEIYLSDIRKGDPARWKTVIRQPIR